MIRRGCASRSRRFDTFFQGTLGIRGFRFYLLLCFLILQVYTHFTSSPLHFKIGFSVEDLKLVYNLHSQTETTFIGSHNKIL